MVNPTEDGYYWLRQDSEYNGVRRDGHPEVVRIVMKYNFRRKDIPFVIAMTWRGPLDELGNGDRNVWHGPIPCPFPGALL
jgi:hypothetical protein